MYTDTCVIYTVTTSKQFGEQITDANPSVCRVETMDKTIRSSDGSTVQYDRLYLLPPSSLVKIGDRIKTTSVNGVTVIENEKEIAKVEPLGAGAPHHLEVYTK